ncbi:hypothetical protein JKP88DRAFT_290263 [Tribonema minus]|uniref:Uncharacterized protein n=1 Tax=Tribonema minus TaxID=303371 RepID=A0A836CF88_9STRA|nr:hypothetical protein JKP88DRAFT_290263 [Tribonema minus]
MAVQSYGGGTSRFTARNSRFSRNRATILGGAFYVFGATAQLFNCTVEDNTATGGSGGGVYVGLNSTLEVIASRLWQNEAGQGDGGALCFDGTMYSKDGDLHAYFYTGNSSDYPINVTIADTSIVKNRAADAGGGIYAVTMVDLTMRNVSSKGNAAAAQAPAFYISDNSVAVFDFCSFTGEITDEGPVSDTSSRFTCVGCTFDGWDSGATPPLPPLARIVNAALSTGSYATALSAAAASALANEGGANMTVDSAEPHLVTGAATCAQGGVCSDDQRLCVDGVAGVYCAAGLDAERMPKAALSEPRDPATGNALNAAPQFTYDPSPRWANLTLDLDCGAAAAPVAWSIAAAEQQGWLIMPTSGIVDCSQSRDMRWLLDANGSNAQEGARMVDISIVGSASTPQNVAFDTTFNVQVWRASGDDSTPQAVTVASATVHSTHWYCRAGLYWDKLQGVCMACGDLPGGASGLRCSAPGATLSYLPVQPGFWVPPDAPLRVLACRSDKVCIGGNGLDTSTLCHEGNTGPYCSLCEDGFAPGMYNVCHACTNSSKATAAALIALVAVIILVLAAVGLVVLLGLTSHFAAVNDVWDCSGMVSTFVRIAREMDWGKFKIPLVAFQIISQFPQITGIEYPPVLARFLAALNVLNLNLGWWLSATCLLEVNFYQQLLLATLTPLCVTAVLVATYFARRAVLLRRAAGHGERLGGDASIAEHLRRARSQHLAVIVILSFVIFSTVNTLLFQTFVCDSLGSSTPDATSYLRADYSLQCDTSEHSAYLVYSSCMIFIYAVGIPALFLGLILRHRRAMRHHQHALTLDSDRGECAEDPRREPEGFQTEGSGMGEATAAAYESRVIRFLTSQYTPQRDYYEVVECCRRLVLTGLLVFIPASVQVETACAFAVLSLALCALLQPYRDLFDYSAAILAGIIVFLSFYIALMGQFVANSSTGVLSHLVVTLSVVLLVVAFMQCLIAAQAVRSSVQGVTTVVYDAKDREYPVVFTADAAREGPYDAPVFMDAFKKHTTWWVL